MLALCSTRVPYWASAAQLQLLAMVLVQTFTTGLPSVTLQAALLQVGMVWTGDKWCGFIRHAQSDTFVSERDRYSQNEYLLEVVASVVWHLVQECA